MGTRKIRIEKGIAIPPRTGRKAIYPFREMEVGDSFFVPNKKSIAYYNKQKKIGFKFAHRRVEENGVKGVRIWRVK